jgi:hypothetical protein
MDHLEPSLTKSRDKNLQFLAKLPETVGKPVFQKSLGEILRQRREL